MTRSDTPDANATVPACTVIVTVDADERVLPDMVAHARAGLVALTDRPGFCDGRLHVSRDGRRLVLQQRWVSEAAYVRWRDDPRWNDLASTRVFMDHVAAGRARVDARTFDLVVDADGPET